jgi:hypothetical protein
LFQGGTSAFVRIPNKDLFPVKPKALIGCLGLSSLGWGPYAYTKGGVGPPKPCRSRTYVRGRPSSSKPILSTYVRTWVAKFLRVQCWLRPVSAWVRTSVDGRTGGRATILSDSFPRGTHVYACGQVRLPSLPLRTPSQGPERIRVRAGEMLPLRTPLGPLSGTRTRT